MLRIAIGIKIFTLLLLISFSSCDSGSRSKKNEYDDKSPDKIALFTAIEKLAQAGNPEAQYHLGMMYNNGLGTDKDPRKAIEWFRKAADAGEPLAAYKVGCYFAGQFPGVVKSDPAEALANKLKAADQGYSFAQSDVGHIYFEQGNFAEAVKWWKLAAEQGYPQALGDLSVAYHLGKIVPEDKTLAYSYFVLATSNSGSEMNPDYKASYDEMASTMTPEELRRAEKAISEWKPNPSPLTRRAMSGLEDAQKLVQTTAVKSQ